MKWKKKKNPKIGENKTKSSLIDLLIIHLKTVINDCLGNG